MNRKGYTRPEFFLGLGRLGNDRLEMGEGELEAEKMRDSGQSELGMKTIGFISGIATYCVWLGLFHY